MVNHDFIFFLSTTWVFCQDKTAWEIFRKKFASLMNFTPSVENDLPPSHVFSVFKLHSFYLCNVPICLPFVFSALKSHLFIFYGQISVVAP